MVKKTILDIDRCTIRYRDRRDAVSQLSLSVRQGEIVSIVGESGSGKTTLIRGILGLLPPGGRITEGHIYFDGKDLAGMPDHALQAIRGKEIAMIFQDVGSALDPIRKIRQQYCESIAVHERLPRESGFGSPRRCSGACTFPKPSACWRRIPLSFPGE